MEVEPTDQRGRTATGSGRNGNEAAAAGTAKKSPTCRCRTGVNGTQIVSPRDILLSLH